ncbi:nucleotidyltransferase family protein [Candidatus Woesearchaeota archaeon]|nr:nucleotidyltransferase family protein [Candidatus Woesearchaeota archaeon]
MTYDYNLQVIKIIKNQPWLMDLLKEVRKLNLLDWYIAAGAIRNTIWNVLHGYSSKSNIKDIDVVYFDKLDITKEKEKRTELLLKSRNSTVDWEVVNQARMRSIHPRLRVESSCESIAYWSEVPTCIGIRLEKNGALTICAPHGLKDLMNLVVKPIPKPYQDLKLYKERIEQKQWEKIWPNLKIIKIK